MDDARTSAIASESPCAAVSSPDGPGIPPDVCAAPEPRGALVVSIPGEPCAQGRGRAVPFRRADGKLSARVYDPAKSRNWKATAQAIMAMAANGLPPLTGPVQVDIVATFACPRSKWRTRQPRPAEWKTSRPDLDNVVKAVKDAAKGVLWIDDSQVARLRAEKITGAQGQAPGVSFCVSSLSKTALDWGERL
jgi:Holliday junction resolvase RusA-like endonuclease